MVSMYLNIHTCAYIANLLKLYTDNWTHIEFGIYLRSLSIIKNYLTKLE